MCPYIKEQVNEYICNGIVCDVLRQVCHLVAGILMFWQNASRGRPSRKWCNVLDIILRRLKEIFEDYRLTRIFIGVVIEKV